MGDNMWTMGLLLPGSENNKVHVASSETWMEGWIFLNSRGEMGELPRITKKDFVNHPQSIFFWELPRCGRV